jgi:hypothetical protein
MNCAPMKCARKGCHHEFKPQRRAQRFCSESCRNETWKRHNGKAPKKRRLLREALPEAFGTYPHLYRIQYPDGWISSPVNLSRAKDAAYGHARHLQEAALQEAA